jgi:isopenicillin-N epimerase
MEAEPVQFLWRRYEERLDPVRAETAKFLGAQARDLVFVTNATTGVNAVVRSLKLRRIERLLYRTGPELLREYRKTVRKP